MQIIQKKISELKFAEYNPRNLTEQQYADLKMSLQEFGFAEPIIINKHKGRENVIVGGHQRVRVAKDIGIKEIPCVEVDLSLTREKELNIRLNKNVGRWDWDALADNFDKDDLLNWGFDDAEFNMFPTSDDDIVDDEFDVPDEVETNIKTGDIITIGSHRLMCGDSTDSDQVAKLMNGKKVDIVFTDPPYGIDIVNIKGNIGGGGKLGFVGVDGKAKARKYHKIIGDDKPFDPLHLLGLSEKILLFGGNHYTDKLPCNSHWLVWDKKPEDAERKNTFSDAELIWTNLPYKTTKIYRYKWFGLVREGKRDIELMERVHPTQKPVGLLVSILKDYSKKDEIVLDSYIGSGSMMVACEQLNRICYGMEISSEYCQVIINRMLQLNPEISVKVNNKEYEKPEIKEPQL